MIRETDTQQDGASERSRENDFERSNFIYNPFI